LGAIVKRRTGNKQKGFLTNRHVAVDLEYPNQKMYHPLPPNLGPGVYLGAVERATSFVPDDVWYGIYAGTDPGRGVTNYLVNVRNKILLTPSALTIYLIKLSDPICISKLTICDQHMRVLESFRKSRIALFMGRKDTTLIAWLLLANKAALVLLRKNIGWAFF
jgi:hypothetical protein